MSEENLTYLLGAGASALAVPVVSQLYDRMEFFIDQFEDYNYSGNLGKWLREIVNSEGLEGEPADFYKKLISKLSDDGERKVVINRMKKILEDARSHQSIDTYAKRLYLQEDRYKYKEVKKFLSLFLLFEQMGFSSDKLHLNHFIEDLKKRDPVVNRSFNFNTFNSINDKRYDQFFAAVLTKGNEGALLRLPSNLNLISWNYDLQMELVLRKYSQCEHLLDVSEGFKIYPRGSGTEAIQRMAEDSTIFKLNGTCGLETDISESHFTSLDSSSLVLPFLSLLSKIFDPSLEDLLKSKRALSFAWEDGNSSPGFVQDICADKISNSSSIVIIGYSFPVFNREIDKQLFSQLREGTKIYIQDLPGNIKSVIHAAESIIPEGNDCKIIPIDKVDQFYVPFEFVPEY